MKLLGLVQIKWQYCLIGISKKRILTIVVGKKAYCVTYCANELAEIDSYGICGVKEVSGQNQTMDDAGVIYKLDYHGSPFLTFTEMEKDLTISPFDVRYYRNDSELAEDELVNVLGEHFVDGAPNSGTGTAELGMFYFLEAIIILLGIIFIRYFLTGTDRGNTGEDN